MFFLWSLSSSYNSVFFVFWGFVLKMVGKSSKAQVLICVNFLAVQTPFVGYKISTTRITFATCFTFPANKNGYAKIGVLQFCT